MYRTIPKKKKCKKAKWLCEEALQIALKRREVNSKGEKGRYTHLNAEFQRIERRDKKTFLSDQSKEIEENNRVGKTTRPFRYDLNQMPYDYTVEVTNRFKGVDLLECLKNSDQNHSQEKEMQQGNGCVKRS